MPLKFEDLDPETRKRIQGLLNKYEGQRVEDGVRVVGSHPVKCPQGHRAAIIVWSDGRVELACPTCGRRGLFEGKEERVPLEVQPPARRRQGSTPLEHTEPLLAMQEVAAALEETQPVNLPSTEDSKEKSQPKADQEGFGQSIGVTLLIAFGYIVAALLAIYFIFGRSYYRPSFSYSYSSSPTAPASSYSPARDTAPPPLQVISPVDGAITRWPKVTVSGVTEPGAIITAKTSKVTREIQVGQDGRFTCELEGLEAGNNTITVVARDAAGNATTATLKVFYEDPATQVPKNYYQVSSPYGRYSNTFSDLCKFLFAFSLPRGYEQEIFDCSESAAMLEWALEISGFKASIAVGPCPWDSNLGSHAWVIANTVDHTVAIEPTVLVKRGLIDKMLLKLQGKAPGVIYQGDPYVSGYYQGYKQLFQDIYEAVRAYGGIDQWNWWEGRWGFQ